MKAKEFGTYEVDGFEVDVSKIATRSCDQNVVELPYLGDIPSIPEHNYAAFVRLFVCPECTRVTLEIVGSNDMHCVIPLEATNDEITFLMDKFFRQKKAATGLDSYWLGVWHAHYIDWKHIRNDSLYVYDIFKSLPEKERSRILSFLKYAESHS